MSTVCHRKHCRGFQHHGRWCGSGIPHDRFHFNKWFVSHIHYTAALVTQLLIPGAQRTVKRILPPSTVASTSVASSSASVADEDEGETSSDASYSSEQQTCNIHDVELDEFQDELRDFIRNLHVPSTSDATSVNTITDAIFAH